jgi:two-component system chemotaxis response regulator CheB
MSAFKSLRGRVDAVVIGTSAGGVEVLSAVLPAISPGLSVPIFIVLHLPRDKPSVLAEIFSRKCAVPVCEAQDKAPAVPGTVYFAPSNYHLLLEAGPQMALSADDLVHHSRPSIDVLFESASDLYRDRLLGIILTGANADGAAGLAAIHDAGGVTVIQRPDTTQSPIMVLAALKLRPVDWVLSPQEIAGLLRTLEADALAVTVN